MLQPLLGQRDGWHTPPRTPSPGTLSELRGDGGVQIIPDDEFGLREEGCCHGLDIGTAVRVQQLRRGVGLTHCQRQHARSAVGSGARKITKHDETMLGHRRHSMVLRSALLG